MSASSTDFRRCGICMELFNQDDRKPKFLQCYHTYCSKCLTKIQGKKKNTNSGAVEFPCPSCRKLTTVGKKGVSALQDNFYLQLTTGVKVHDDEVYLSDDEDINTMTTQTADTSKKKVVKVWCETCLKEAGPECSLHDICNLELGKKRLKERLQSALAQADKELDWEVKVREPQVTHLQAAHRAWTSGLAERLEEQINAQSMALTIARSELGSLDTLKRLRDEDDSSVVAAAVKKTEALVASAQSRTKVASKQVALLMALQICHIKIQPVLDNHDKNTKLPELVIRAGSSDSNEEKALAYLMYHILENKGGEADTGNGSWQLVGGRAKSKGIDDNDTQNKSKISKARSSSLQRSDFNNFATTSAMSAKPLLAAHNTKIFLNKDIGSLNVSKGLRCFFDIAIGGKLSGRIVIHLRPDVATKMCANFVALCTGELGYGYKGSKIFKALANDHIVGGDFEKNDGTGGHSIYNNKSLFVADNCGLKDEKGAVRMRGMGKDEKTGGGMVGSQFHIWVRGGDFRSYFRTLVIGNVIEGLELCNMISNFKTHKNVHGTYIINHEVVIHDCGKL